MVTLLGWKTPSFYKSTFLFCQYRSNVLWRYSGDFREWACRSFKENRVFSNYCSVIEIVKEDTQADTLCLLSCVLIFWYYRKPSSNLLNLVNLICLSFVEFQAPKPTVAPNPCAVRCKSNNKCVSSTQVCDFVNDCGRGDNSDEKNCGACTFEQGAFFALYNKHNTWWSPMAFGVSLFQLRRTCFQDELWSFFAQRQYWHQVEKPISLLPSTNYFHRENYRHRVFRFTRTVC